jgi:hypothetical protein
MINFGIVDAPVTLFALPLSQGYKTFSLRQNKLERLSPESILA